MLRLAPDHLILARPKPRDYPPRFARFGLLAARVFNLVMALLLAASLNPIVAGAWG